MGYVHRTPRCCGLGELSGLSRIEHNNTKVIEEILCDIWRQIRASNQKDHVAERAVYVFTQAQSRYSPYPQTYGENFASYLVRNSLGEVVRTPVARVNPNSGNKLLAWLWAVDWKHFEQLARERGWEKTPVPPSTIEVQAHAGC